MVLGRALHYVFKIGDRTRTAQFYRDVLGMQVLRHEEFSEGCEATCNGPYANRWSKTMIGYGPEDTHFVIELTYNYGVHSYKKGNEFVAITIKNNEILKRAKNLNWPIKSGNILEAPGGYNFKIIDEPSNGDPIQKVTLRCSNLLKSINYWNGLLGLTIFDRTDKSASIGFNEKQAKLELVESDDPVNRAEAFGRIAFACPSKDQEALNKIIEAHKEKIIHPLTVLDTPGKPSVTVLILADPDDLEICFVDEESFRELSKVDPDGNRLLDKFIKSDRS